MRAFRYSRERAAAVLLLALAFALPLRAAAQASGVANSVPAAESGGGEAMRVARQEGSADTAILDWVLANSGPFTGSTLAGGFRMAYTITPAEGWWDKSGESTLAWHEPPSNQLHLRIFVVDTSDGRLVNDLLVGVTLIDANGNELALPVSFGWYPLINAYGCNFALPSDGNYRLRVSIAAPQRGVDELGRGEGLARMTLAEFPEMSLAQSSAAVVPLATETASATEAKLLKPASDALGAAIAALWRQSASGAEKADGDYFVAYALGDAEKPPLARLWNLGGEPQTRLEVLVRDSRTGRPIPFLAPQIKLESAGDLYDRGTLEPIRHPWLNLYGSSVYLPRKGAYRLNVTVAAPGFRRWGRQSARFALPAKVEFDDVSLQPQAAKPSGKPQSGTHP